MKRVKDRVLHFLSIWKNFGLKTALLFFLIRDRVWRYHYIRKYLTKKFRYVIDNFKVPSTLTVEKKSFRIWVFWYQDDEEIPPIVKICIKRLKAEFSHGNICIINKTNYFNYVQLDDNFQQLFVENKINVQALADVLRIKLLSKYGGVWVDATLYMLDCKKCEQAFYADFYTQKFYREKDYQCPYKYSPSFGRWATFVMATNKINHPLFIFVSTMFDEYFKKYDYMLDYYLIDFFIDIGYDNIPAIKESIDNVSINNPNIYELMNCINDIYNDKLMDEWSKNTFLFKMSWRSVINLSKKDTYYSYLLSLEE